MSLQDDELSPFIPTFRAIPLHPGAWELLQGRPAAACKARLLPLTVPGPPPLPAECDGGRPVLCRYPVADRANAVRQFLAAADLNPALIKVGAVQAIARGCCLPASVLGSPSPPLRPPHPATPATRQAPWLLLIESDFLFARPVAAPGTAEDPGVRSQAFFYTYIFPEAKIMKASEESGRVAAGVGGPPRRLGRQE